MPDRKEALKKGLAGEAYRYLSLLRENEEEGISTHLIQDRQTGEKLLVKAAGAEGADLLKNEWDILGQLSGTEGDGTDLFPRPVALENREWNGKTYLCLTRTWIEGTSLDSLVEGQTDRCGLPRRAALHAVICTAEQVACLHHLSEPVIHRDIKPQNVIMDRTGLCHLIDFGISRRKDDRLDHDTVVAGTRMISPPEQFGYRSTDERSDVYALGVLLHYLLTGDYSLSEHEGIDDDLYAIVTHATRFDPADRYASVEEMLEELYRARGMKKRKGEDRPGKSLFSYLGWAVALVLGCVLAGLGLSGRITPGVPPQQAAKPVVFAEPLMEQAVRASLGRPEGELTKEDLEQVTSIHIYGSQVYLSESDVWHVGSFPYFWDASVQEAGLFMKNGGMRTLEDVRMLPRLRELCVYNQKLEDLSPLKGMALSELGIGYNPVRDLSSLEGMPLKYLHIGGIPLTDTAPLSGLASLETLDLSDTDLEQLGFLQNVPVREMRVINCRESLCLDLASLPGLRVLTLGFLSQPVLEALSATQVEELTVLHTGQVSFRDMAAMPSLRRLYFYGDGADVPAGGPVNLPRLEWLDLKAVHAADLGFLSGLQELRTLHLYAMEADSYAGLEDLPRLENIVCLPEQKEAMVPLYPEASWVWGV